MAQTLYNQRIWLLTMPTNYKQGWFCWHNFQKGHHLERKELSGEAHRG
jgi:aldehyde:ferredoxin oxidoreductase